MGGANLASIIHRFHYLKYGLSLVLVVVGMKMQLVDIYKVPTALALGITVTLIGGSIIVSMLKTRAEAAPGEAGAEVRHGWMPGSPAKGPAGEPVAASSDGKGR